jgi:hypothetical protein
MLANQELDILRRKDIMKQFKVIYDTIDTVKLAVNRLTFNACRLFLIVVFFLTGVFFFMTVFFFVTGRFATTRFAAPTFDHVVYIIPQRFTQGMCIR